MTRKAVSYRAFPARSGRSLAPAPPRPRHRLMMVPSLTLSDIKQMLNHDTLVSAQAFSSYESARPDLSRLSFVRVFLRTRPKPPFLN